MNHNRDFTRILHILKYTRKLHSLALKIDSVDVFKENEDNVDLVSFWIFQISENIANLSDDYKLCYPEIEWRILHRFRTIAAHKYESLDIDSLWSIWRNRIPKLHEFVQQQIDKVRSLRGDED